MRYITVILIFLNLSFPSIPETEQEILIDNFEIMNGRGSVQFSVSAFQPIMGNSQYN